jgi:hypothetical protein
MGKSCLTFFNFLSASNAGTINYTTFSCFMAILHHGSKRSQKRHKRGRQLEYYFFGARIHSSSGAYFLNIF